MIVSLSAPFALAASTASVVCFKTSSFLALASSFLVASVLTSSASLFNFSSFSAKSSTLS